MKQWYVVYVNSRAEKKVAERLHENDIEIFCPLKTEIRQWSDRKKKLLVPYFPSYVFVRMNLKKERLKVLQTPGVAMLLFWLKKPAVIKDEEMAEVKAFFLEHKSRNILREEIITSGESYQIQYGPLAGKSGIVLWQNSERVLLEVSGMNMRFSVEKKDLETLKTD